MNGADFDLLRRYIMYYISAPCFEMIKRERMLKDLKKSRTVQEVAHVVARLTKLGVEPL